MIRTNSAVLADQSIRKWARSAKFSLRILRAVTECVNAHTAPTDPPHWDSTMKYYELYHSQYADEACQYVPEDKYITETWKLPALQYLYHSVEYAIRAKWVPVKEISLDAAERALREHIAENLPPRFHFFEPKSFPVST